MRVREYNIETQKENIDLKICVVSDLHARVHTDCLAAVKSTEADMILCAGDMLERLDGSKDEHNASGIEFLREISKLAPTYYAFGNHERFGSHREMRRNPIGDCYITLDNLERIQDTGVILVNDKYVACNNIYIGGVVPVEENANILEKEVFLREFSLIDGYKILLSHQPEYYDELKNFDFDLIISGHAHGGQWRIFNRGVYAPDQGLFPKYSAGIYDQRLVVCTGATNTSKPIPRIFNPTEILLLHIKTK